MTPKFKNIEEFYDFLPTDELETSMILLEMIRDSMPEAREKLSYNVPYFHRNRAICFVWPASVLWGKKKTYSGVRFGFVHGYLLNDEAGFLSKGNRKQVFWIDLKSPSVARNNLNLIRDYLFEAIIIDDQFLKK